MTPGPCRFLTRAVKKDSSANLHCPRALAYMSAYMQVWAWVMDSLISPRAAQ